MVLGKGDLKIAAVALYFEVIRHCSAVEGQLLRHDITERKLCLLFGYLLESAVDLYAEITENVAPFKRGSFTVKIVYFNIS